MPLLQNGKAHSPAKPEDLPFPTIINELSGERPEMQQRSNSLENELEHGRF